MTIATPPLSPPRQATDQEHRRVPWDWSDLIIWLVAGAAIYVVLTIGLVVLSYAIDPKLDLTDPPPLFNLINQVLLDGTAAGLVLALVLVRRHGTWQMLGLCMPRPRWFAIVPGLVAASYGLAVLLSVASDHLFPSATSDQCQTVKTAFGSNYPVAFLAIAVAAPFAEELAFRGFLFGWLRSKMPVWAAAVISGGVFGAVHAQGALTLALIGVGIMLAYAYHRSGSLYVTILTHATFNALNLWAILYQPC